jgi:hypothetical protein
MSRKIRIVLRPIGELQAEIFEEKNPRTAEAVWNSLPLEGKVNRWGDEIYFEIPLKLGRENAQQIVEVGDIAYWPPGNALCIFFGPTPSSKGDEPRAYSPVNVFGKIIGDPTVLKKLRTGDLIRIERI